MQIRRGSHGRLVACPCRTLRRSISARLWAARALPGTAVNRIRCLRIRRGDSTSGAVTASEIIVSCERGVLLVFDGRHLWKSMFRGATACSLLTFAQVVNVGRPTGARPRASPRWTHRRTTFANINSVWLLGRLLAARIDQFPERLVSCVEASVTAYVWISSCLLSTPTWFL